MKLLPVEPPQVSEDSFYLLKYNAEVVEAALASESLRPYA